MLQVGIKTRVRFRISTIPTVGAVGYAHRSSKGFTGCINMRAQLLNSLIIAGYLQEYITLIKQAGDRITAARKQLDNFCGGDKETSRQGGK